MRDSRSAWASTHGKLTGVRRLGADEMALVNGREPKSLVMFLLGQRCREAEGATLSHIISVMSLENNQVVRTKRVAWQCCPSYLLAADC
jgi:hypothetical protein